MNIYFGMELALVLVLTLCLVKLKAHISKETFAGMFVCLGNGFIGTKLARNPVMIRCGLKLKEAILKDNSAGILVILRVNSFIGMVLAQLNVLSHWKHVIRMDNGSVIIPAQILNISIGMDLVSVLVLLLLLLAQKVAHPRTFVIIFVMLMNSFIGTGLVKPLVTLLSWQ